MTSRKTCTCTSSTDNMTLEQLAVVQRGMAAYRAAHPRPAVAPRAESVFGDMDPGDHAMLLVGTGGLAHAGMVIGDLEAPDEIAACERSAKHSPWVGAIQNRR